MKSIKFLFPLAVIILCLSCAAHMNFPVSDVTPAARIEARVHADKNDNTSIDITAKYLSNADRLTPSKNTYVIWVETLNNGFVNIGQLKSRSSKTSKLETITPFEPIAIFITAEEDGNVKIPQGTFITRIEL